LQQDYIHAIYKQNYIHASYQVAEMGFLSIMSRLTHFFYRYFRWFELAYASSHRIF